MPKELIGSTYGGAGVVEGMFVPKSLRLLDTIYACSNTSLIKYFAAGRMRNGVSQRLLHAFNFLNLLCRQSLRQDQAYDKDGWVQLKSTLIRGHCGKNYSSILNYLHQLKIIEIFQSKSGRFSYSNRRAKAFCKKYRLQLPYRGDHWVPLDEQFNPIEKDIEAVCPYILRTTRPVSIKSPFEGYLYQCLERVNLAPEAEDYIRDFPFPSGEAFQRNYSKFVGFRDQKFFFHRDHSNTKRIYHSVTNLPAHSECGDNIFNLRQFLRLDGEPLIAFDISASQPFFAQVFYEHATGFPLNAVSAERNRYLELFHGGRSFYDNLNEKYLESQYTRAKVKVAFIQQILFAERSNALTTKGGKAPWDAIGEALFRVFDSQFPIFLAEIQKSKTLKLGECSNFLSRIEAGFILDTVCKELIWGTPDIPIITIHDCILTTPTFSNLVKATMERLFEERFGFSPRIKFEMLEPDLFT